MISAVLFASGLVLGLMAGAFAAWWVLAGGDRVPPEWGE